MCDSLSCGCYTARKNEMGTALATVWWMDGGITFAGAVGNCSLYDSHLFVVSPLSRSLLGIKEPVHELLNHLVSPPNFGGLLGRQVGDSTN